MKKDRSLMSRVGLYLGLVLIVSLLVVGCAKSTPSPAAPAPKPPPSPAAPAPKPAAKPPPSAASPAPSPAVAKPPAKIPVLVGGPDPAWTAYAAAVGAGDIANRNTNLNATVKSHAGLIPLLDALVAGKVDLAFGPAEYTWPGPFYGEAEYKGKPPAKNLRAVLAYMRLYSSIDVLSSSGIKTIPQLKGKNMAWHTATSMSTAQALLEAYGLDPKKDIRQILVPGQPESVQEITMRRADAMWSAVEVSVLVQLADSMGKIYPLPWDPDKFEWMKQNRLSAVRGMTLAKIQPGYRAHLDIPTGGQLVAANVWNVGTHAAVPVDVIYTFTKAMLDNMDKFRVLHKQFAEFGPGMVQLASEIPYHEGAIKALKEKALWSAEMERVHQLRLKAAS